jgi:hypothetical protein
VSGVGSGILAAEQPAPHGVGQGVQVEGLAEALVRPHSLGVLREVGRGEKDGKHVVVLLDEEGESFFYVNNPELGEEAEEIAVAHMAMIFPVVARRAAPRPEGGESVKRLIRTSGVDGGRARPRRRLDRLPLGARSLAPVRAPR